MLVNAVKTALSSNQIAVVIGARGTGKSPCAEALKAEWQSLGIRPLRLDASTAKYPEDLNAPLADMLKCEPNSLTAEHLDENEIVRVLVDRCDSLFDQSWVAEWQEQWRALFTSKAAHGRLAAVLFGRPIFRQVAGGEASPLLNAGRVLTVAPLQQAELESTYGFDSQLAASVRRKTGGHPTLTAKLAESFKVTEDFKRTVRDVLKSERGYIVRLVRDQSVAGQALLGELLQTRDSVHESALIKRHFEGAYADGIEALEDLCACGLIRKSSANDYTVGADLLRNVDGLQEIATAPTMSPPSYDAAIMDACWRCLFFSENKLRQLVAERLCAVDDAWWILHVPPEVRGAAEGRKKSEIVIAASEEDQSHPLMYLTLNELFELIFANWSRVFGAAFSPLSQSAVREVAQKVEAIRNRLAHSRPVSEDQLREFEMLAKRLGLLSASLGPAVAR
ncbi:MAG TPA: Swt1 family HEPN domain-containing protein [Solirubrobacterales bacterium]|nr:Swt1 family HEPN domain-containing protein [Solirubrobacterales bacterium]